MQYSRESVEVLHATSVTSDRLGVLVVSPSHFDIPHYCMPLNTVDQMCTYSILIKIEFIGVLTELSFERDCSATTRSTVQYSSSPLFT